MKKINRKNKTENSVAVTCQHSYARTIKASSNYFLCNITSGAALDIPKIFPDLSDDVQNILFVLKGYAARLPPGSRQVYCLLIKLSD